MSYQTGTINSFSELKAIMSSELTANGWTEEANGGISLFKSGKCHVTVEVEDVANVFNSNHQTFDFKELRYPIYEAFNFHNIGAAKTSNSVALALSAHWPINISFVGIPNQEITFIWVGGQPASAGKWSVSGSVSGAFPDATVRVPYENGGLSFSWTTRHQPYQYYYLLDDVNNWPDASTPPTITFPVVFEANQGMWFKAGHESDGAGALTGQSPAINQRKLKGFYSRQNDGEVEGVPGDLPVTRNIFPAKYHVHVLSDPNEVWLIIEDSRFQSGERSVRNTWLGFGETKSQAKGFYFVGSLTAWYEDNSPLNYATPFHRRDVRSETNTNYINNGSDRVLNPFSQDYDSVLYDPIVGERYKEMSIPYNRSAYAGVAHLLKGPNDQSLGSNRSIYNRGHSSVLNQPWLCPITFEIGNSTSNDSTATKVMVTAEINGVRHISMNGVLNGEVISDGANNWICYAGFEREIGATGRYTSGNFGFAIQYDGP